MTSNYLPLIDRVRAEHYKAELAGDAARADLAGTDLTVVMEQVLSSSLTVLPHIVRLTKARADSFAVARQLGEILRQHEASSVGRDLAETEAVVETADRRGRGPGANIPFDVRMNGELELARRYASELGPLSEVGTGARGGLIRGDVLGALGERIKAGSLYHVADELRRILDEDHDGAGGEFLIGPEARVEPMGPVSADEARHALQAMNRDTRRTAAAATGILATVGLQGEPWGGPRA